MTRRQSEPAPADSAFSLGLSSETMGRNERWRDETGGGEGGHGPGAAFGRKRSGSEHGTGETPLAVDVIDGKVVDLDESPFYRSFEPSLQAQVPPEHLQALGPHPMEHAGAIAFASFPSTPRGARNERRISVSRSTSDIATNPYSRRKSLANLADPSASYAHTEQDIIETADTDDRRNQKSSSSVSSAGAPIYHGPNGSRAFGLAATQLAPLTGLSIPMGGSNSKNESEPRSSSLDPDSSIYSPSSYKLLRSHTPLASPALARANPFDDNTTSSDNFGGRRETSEGATTREPSEHSRRPAFHQKKSSFQLSTQQYTSGQDAWSHFMHEYARGNWNPTTIPNKPPGAPDIYLPRVPGASKPMTLTRDQLKGDDTKVSQVGSMRFGETSTPESTEVRSPEDHLSDPDDRYLRPPFPIDEEARQQALYRYRIMYTKPDLNFDRIAHLTKLTFQPASQVLISLVANELQWFKTAIGLPDCTPAREASLCAHSILQRSGEPMVILDTHKDWRFKNNPNVTGQPYVRFYAGAPIRTADGHNLGVLCVLDERPRQEFGPRQRHMLKEMAAIVMRELELWSDKLQLRSRARQQKKVDEFTRQCLKGDDELATQHLKQKRHGRDRRKIPPLGLDFVFQLACEHILDGLEVEGVSMIDIRSFEKMETMAGSSYAYIWDQNLDLFEKQFPATTASIPEHDPKHHKLSLNTEAGTAAEPISIPMIPILGESWARDCLHKDLKKQIQIDFVSDLLSRYPHGIIYSHNIPTSLRNYISTAKSAILLPIWNVDNRPFALVIAHTSDSHRVFEDQDLSFMQAIGTSVLSAVMKKRVMIADKAKGTFISNISHELRTPLHGILASLELLSDTPLDRMQTSFLHTIESCGRSLIEVINHVLDFSKIGQSSMLDKQKMQDSIDMACLVEEVILSTHSGQSARAWLGHMDVGSLYAPIPASGGSRSSVEMEQFLQKQSQTEILIEIGRPGEAGWAVTCEKGGIRRILMNLIGNSLKFTKRGYVHVGLRYLPRSPSMTGVPIELMVSDTGKGMSANFLQNQLFQPFTQEDELAVGTGLGMAMVKQIVDSLGGKIEVRSEEGSGTEIRVTLEVDPCEPAAIDGPTLSVGLNAGQRYSVGTVGFHEDHKGQALAKKLIEKYADEWFNFTTATDSLAADILVVNDDSSIDVCKVLRNASSRTPIIIWTYRSNLSSGPWSEAVKEFESRGGFVCTLLKPSGPSKIGSVLNECMDRLDGLSGESGLGRDSPHNAVFSPGDEKGDYFGSDAVSDSSGMSNTIPLPIAPVTALQKAKDEFANTADEQVRFTAAVRVPTSLSRRHSDDPKQVVEFKPGTRPLLPQRSISYSTNSLRRQVTVSPITSARDSLAARVMQTQIQAKSNTIAENYGALNSPTDSLAASDVALSSGSTMSPIPNELDELGHQLSLPPTSTEESRKKVSVLVVEDNRVNRQILATFLAKKGFDFEEAEDGQEGIDVFAARTSGFDVILMDIQMPRKNGYEATLAIRQIERTREEEATPEDPAPHQSKIFALTGLATSEDKREAWAAGIDAHLAKPVSLKVLGALFQKLGY